MFPQGELNQIALQKARLQRLSALHREECSAAAAELARPLEWVDDVREKWKRLSPLVKMGGLAAGLMARRRILPAVGGLGRWIRWGTAAVGLVRGLRASRR